MTPSPRTTVVVALLVCLVLAGSGTAFGLAASTGTGAALDDEETLNSTTNTTTNLTSTTGDTTDSIIAAVEGTSASLETGGDSSGTDDGSGEADLAVESSVEASAADRLMTALADDRDGGSLLVGVPSGLTTNPDAEAVRTLLTRDPGSGSGTLDDASVADAGDGGTAAGGAAGDSEGTPLPNVPSESVVGGGLVGALAVGYLFRQEFLTGMSSARMTAGALAAPVAAAGSDVWERLVRMVAPLRYSRYDDSDPLEHEVRGRMFEVVKRSPGAYLSELSEQAGVPLSTARHHVRVLEREGLLASAKVRGRRRFYPGGREDLALAAALNDGATAGVLDALARIGPSSVSALAEELDRDPSTVTHHLTRLEEDGIVLRERDGRAIVNRLAPEAAAALDPEVESEAKQPTLASAD